MTTPDHEVVIIGAGPGGIASAYLLQQKGIHDFVIIDREHGAGSLETLENCVRARAASMSIFPEMLTIATEISRSAGVAILTNNGLMVRDYLPQICPPLFPLFSARVFCSAQFKIEKPDPDIYRRCLAALGIAEERAIFVDDKLANVEGATRAGMMGHHFTDPPTLRAELQALGLLEKDHAT